VLGDATEQSDTAEALESAKGMLRTEVGRQTGIRHTPSLAFIADAIPETARHLDDLLRAARADDERVHEQAVAATYAGESDPYRHDEDLDGGDLEEVGLDDAGLEEAGGASA
jgi:ribosome-binding factor A